MCVSLASAILAGTIISLSEAIHPVTGRQVFVLTYTNRVQHTGPVGAGNAMLLHFPARKMTRDCAIDTTAFATFADDLVEAVNPANHGARSFSAMMEPTRGAVDVFDVGAYTVVLAERAGDIPAALARVPEKRRPKLNQAIFDWYERQFPDNSFAALLLRRADDGEGRSADVLVRAEPDGPPDAPGPRRPHRRPARPQGARGPGPLDHPRHPRA